jgi:hypothetical protein
VKPRPVVGPGDLNALLHLKNTISVIRVFSHWPRNGISVLTLVGSEPMRAYLKALKVYIRLLLIVIWYHQVPTNLILLAI